MSEADPHIYCIGPLTLDLAQGRLFSSGGDIALRPKAFRMLGVLAQQAGRVVPKDELLSEVWPDVIVSDDSLTQCVHELRQALGAEAAALLRTLPRRGYMLTEASTTAMALPERPSEEVEPGSIAVMPLMLPPEVDPRERVLFDGLVHDVITRLARLRAFRVTGRGSTFALRHLAEDPVRLRGLLKVAYVVSGRVCPPMAGGQVRLLVDLVRTQDGSLEWSDEVVLAADGLPMAALEVADRLVTAIALAVTEAERKRALSLRNAAPQAWEEFHLGMDSVFRFSMAGMTQALEHFNAATAMDPRFARAHAFASFCKYYFAFTGPSADRQTGAAAALASASAALDADDGCPPGHWAYGRALWLKGDPEAGLRHTAHALDLSPSFVQAHYMMGFIEAQSGDAAAALEHLDRAEGLSPFDPFLGSIQIVRAGAHLRLGDRAAAAHWAARAAGHRTAYSQMLCYAALILDWAGEATAAREIAARIRALDPGYTAERLFGTLYALPEDVVRSLQVSQGRLGL
jgi:DNA-binding winged helix-turn-helix (wHTH) protein/tetratricopeptide (TPR) repeat protein